MPEREVTRRQPHRTRPAAGACGRHGYDAIVLEAMLKDSTARRLPLAARDRVWSLR